MSEKTKHALLSPSGAKAWRACPGKPAMEMTYCPSGISGSDADEGTFAHEIAAECLALAKPASAYIGTKRTINGNEFVFDDDMAKAVQVYLDICINLSGGYRIHPEQEVPIDHLTGEQGATGTSDCVIVRPIEPGSDDLEVAVVDLKFGRGVKVDAADNEQLAMYALGTIRKLLEGKIDMNAVLTQPATAVEEADDLL